jgi:hypothetical protein
MNSTPRDVLIEIVTLYGRPLLGSPQICEGLLKDYCGEFRGEIFVLVSCLRSGLVEQLLHQSGPSIKLVCARLALKLEQNLATSSDIAKWALESWAIALGLLQPDAATPRLSESIGVFAGASGQNLLLASEPGAGEGKSADDTVPLPPVDDPLIIHDPDALEFLADEPESRWPLPDWSNPERNVIVYPEGSDQEPKLQDAVGEAVPHSRLQLKPGVHRVSLIVKKDLQICSEDDLPGVILESVSSSVVVLEGACLLLSHLTLKGIPGKDQKTLPTVEVKAGHLIMEDCDITSEVSTIMEIKGPESEAVLRGCHLHGSKAGGILFQDEAGGYLENCHFYRNKLSHVVIGKGSTPTLFDCKISHSAMAGIYAIEGGTGLVENCDIWQNAVGGIQCRRGANPRFRHCRISMNERYGVLIAEQAEGIFEHCQIFNNARMGVTVSQQSKPQFSTCQIFDNHGEGVDLDEQTGGEWLDCEIFNNEGANFAARGQSTPHVYRCVIHDGHKEGALITSSSEGRFEGCEFYGNALTAIFVAQNSKPVFDGCVLHDGKENAMTFLETAEGKCIDCEITHHAGTAVMIAGQSWPLLERCHILNNKAIGVHIDETSAPRLKDCVIRENGGIGLLVRGGGTAECCDLNGNLGGDWDISMDAKLRAWSAISD